MRFRDARNDLIFVRVDPGATAQVGAGLEPAALERIATLLHQRYDAPRIAWLPLLPDHAGLAWEIIEDDANAAA
jgi:hypothetical protein